MLDKVTLKRMKQIIRQRGWTKGTVCSKEGKVCLYGAYLAAAHGLNGATQAEFKQARQKDSKVNNNDVGVTDPALMALSRVVKDRDSDLLPGFISTITTYNDRDAESEEEILGVIDEAIQRL